MKKLFAFIAQRGSYFGYLGLTLLVVIALMNVVHNIAYRVPTDGAEWRQIDGRLQVVEVDLSAADSFQIGDVLRAIDGEPIDTYDAYEEYLYEQMPIGSKHIYALERAGEPYEPYVEINGLKEDKTQYYLFAVTGFVYLLFMFLILSQSFSFEGKRALVGLCFFVFLAFVFHYTDRFTLLDWISFFVAEIGGILLPSSLAAVAVTQAARHSKLRTPLQLAHWVPSISLMLLTLIGLFQFTGALPLTVSANLFETIQRWQGFWGGGLILLALITFLYAAEKTHHSRNTALFWSIAWLPFSLRLWGLDYPFANFIAAVAPAVLPVALLAEWRTQDEFHLGHLGKKLLVYLFVVFVLLIGYFVFLGLFQWLLGAEIGEGGQTIILAFGIMFAAVSYRPLHGYAADLLDKLLYGKRLEAIRILSDFAGINRADTHMDDFLKIITSRIKNAFLFDAEAYTIKESPDRFAAISRTQLFSFDELPTALFRGDIIRGDQTKARITQGGEGHPFQPEDWICPLRVTGRLAALLVLRPEQEDLKLSPEELRMLTSLLHQCEVLMENMDLYRSIHEKAESMNQLKEYNDNVIESSRTGILTTDESGRAVSCNSALAELAGVSKPQILGQTIDQLFKSRQVKYRRQVKSGYAIEGSYRNIKGQELILEIEKTPLRTQDNHVYGVLYLIEDIRERKRFDEKLLQQEKLASIGMLAAGVAHEINTPLTGITSYSQMLVKDPTLSEDARELIDLIQGQSQRAANIISELLHFSRKQAGERGPVDLCDVMHQTLRFLHHQLQKRKVVVTFAEPTEQALIDGYANQIQQVYLNLLVNAIDAMPDGGDIHLSVTNTQNGVDVAIRDSGLGMDEETRARIFDPFFTTKEVGKGTGLGLAVVYKILQDHGASIDVDSEQDKGTTFHIHFQEAQMQQRVGSGAA